jgi:hypothetical protein
MELCYIPRQEVVNVIYFHSLTTAIVVARRRTLCLIFYVILCLMLAVNVVSCHLMAANAAAHF